MTNRIHRRLVQKISFARLTRGDLRRYRLIAFIARRGYHDYAGFMGAPNSGFQAAAETGTGETEIYDIRSVSYRVIDRPDNVLSIPFPPIVQCFKRHYPDTPGNPGNSSGVIAGSGRDSGHYRPVRHSFFRPAIDEFRFRISYVIDKIPSVGIVDKTVSIVIYSVADDFSGIAPNIIRQVGVVKLHPGIYYGNDGLCTFTNNVPCFRRLYLL